MRCQETYLHTDTRACSPHRCRSDQASQPAARYGDIDRLRRNNNILDYCGSVTPWRTHCPVGWGVSCQLMGNVLKAINITAIGAGEVWP